VSALEKPAISSEDGPPGRDGSPLCLACGFCCTGLLHAYTPLRADEVELVRAHGLSLDPSRPEPSLAQPCALHRDGRCSIYETGRPRTCVRYSCALLTGFLVGTVSLERTREIVRRTRELEVDAVALLPPGLPLERLNRELDESWQEREGFLGSPARRQEHARLLLALAILHRYLARHFLPAKSKEAASSP